MLSYKIVQTLFTNEKTRSTGSDVPGKKEDKLSNIHKIGKMNILTHFFSQLIVSFSQSLACWVINLLNQHTLSNS
jgi:hypothetical protein